jgi:HD superfamily phosphodiesterase
MQKYISKLNNILKSHNVCNSHGIEHAINVMNHAEKAIIYEKECSLDDKNAVLLASLLHDADDKKFFPNNKNNENVRSIINDKSSQFIELVIKMIDLVSASKNADNIPEDIEDKLWMLYGIWFTYLKGF